MRRCQSKPRLLLAMCLAAAVLLPLSEASGQQAKPTICQALEAQLSINRDAPASETAFDTRRVQDALATCPAGQAVELTSSPTQDAFLLAPLRLPAGVGLWIDAGVTVFASRYGADYRVPGAPALALITVERGAPDTPRAVLGGYGIVDARSPSLLLDANPAQPGSWFSRALEARPVVVAAAGALRISGITIRDAPGIAVTVAETASLEVTGVKVIGDPDAPGTQAIVSAKPSSVRVTGSTLLSSGLVLTTPDASRDDSWIASTRIYAGHLAQPFAAPCLADSAPAFRCVATPFPTLLTEFVQTGAKEVAVLLTVPDTRVAAPHGTVSLLEGEAVVGSVPIRSSAALFDLSALPEGSHQLRARLDSSGESLGQLSFGRAVPASAPATLSLTASATSFPYGTPLTLTAALAGATGAVSFFDGTSQLGQAIMSHGSASITVAKLELGPHTVSAVYAGDTGNPVQQSPSLTLQVNPVTTIASLGALPPSVPYGTTLMLSASVLPVTATGMVSFRDGTTLLGQATLSGGAATLAVPNLQPGAHTLTVSYPGDHYDLAATSPAVRTTVEQLSTTTALAAAPATVSFGTNVTVNVAVAPVDSTGVVTLLEGVSVLARLQLNGGAAATTLPGLAPGLHLLVASYPGDAQHTASSSSSQAVQVERDNTSTVLAPIPGTLAGNAAVVLIATVTPSSATGLVSFTDRNSGPLGQASLAAGSATLTLPQLAPGPHSIVANYTGDTEDAPSSSAAVGTTVALSAATLLLSGVAPTLPFSAPATMGVSVAPSAATGSVALADSASGALGTALLGGGAGSFSLPLLAPGVHVLEARYSGDGTYLSAAASLSLTVVPDLTTTSLTTAQAAVPAGSPILVNVRVSTAYSNSPGGTVNVRVSSAGSSVVVAGTLLHTLPGEAFATVSVDSAVLGVGSYSAIATYPGDLNDNPSASPAVSFSVTPTPVTMRLTLSSNPVPVGVPVHLSATLSSLAGVPTGSIAFFRDGVPLGSGPVVNGSSSLPLPALAPGTYTLTATYTPTGLFGPAVAPAQVLVVTLPISIALTPASLSMKAGSDASTTLVITPLSGYAGTYAASCVPSSAFMTCRIDPATGPGPSSPLVHLHAAATTVAHRENDRSPGWLALGLPLILLLSRRRTRARLFLLALVLLPGLGCGKGDFFDLPPGSYPVTVTVTAAGSSLSTSLNVAIIK